ncbi:MAG: hypothetical protein V3V61_03130 [Gammaproteobacteria bacterium]
MITRTLVAMFAAYAVAVRGAGSEQRGVPQGCADLVANTEGLTGGAEMSALMWACESLQEAGNDDIARYHEIDYGSGAVVDRRGDCGTTMTLPSKGRKDSPFVYVHSDIERPRVYIPDVRFDECDKIDARDVLETCSEDAPFAQLPGPLKSALLVTLFDPGSLKCPPLRINGKSHGPEQYRNFLVEFMVRANELELAVERRGSSKGQRYMIVDSTLSPQRRVLVTMKFDGKPGWNVVYSPKALEAYLESHPPPSNSYVDTLVNTVFSFFSRSGANQAPAPAAAPGPALEL